MINHYSRIKIKNIQKNIEMEAEKDKTQNQEDLKEKINKLSGTQFLILKNLQGLLNLVLEEIADFKQSNPMKVKSISVLSFIISQCGYKISPDTYTRNGGILSNIYKYIDGDEDISQKCDECSVMIGKSTDQNILIPLIIKTITEMETTSSYQPLYVRIKFLANYLEQLPNISNDNTKIILDTLNTLDIFNIDDQNFSKKILINLFNIYNSIINSLKENCTKYHELIFFPLLLLSSLPETFEIRNNVITAMTELAKNCKCSVEDLYSLEIGNVLEKFQSTYKNWKRNSPDRFAFDIYVKLAGTALEKHWTQVLLIISQCCEAEKDIEMRMDMILLLDKIISQKELKEQLKNYTEFILPEILFPACVWRVGRPNYKVRKAAMLDIIHMFDNELIDSEIVLKFFTDFNSTLKSTLEDDWDAELRYIALQLLKSLLITVKDTMKYDHMSDMYIMILKRLDDSQDACRILTCDVLVIFLEIGKRLQISESIYEYMINNSFIHLDDPNEKVREAVGKYLMEAATIHTKCFLKICEKNENSFTHKSNFNEVKGKAEEILSKQ